MRLHVRMAVFVTAVLVGHVTLNAQETAPRLTPVPETPVNPSLEAEMPGGREYRGLNRLKRPNDPFFFNGYSLHRSTADLGAPGAPTHGFKNFILPMDKYTTWYRPRAATLTKRERCAPDPFRPRGYGNLFAEPCDSFRMEYAPYELQEGQTPYGPSYIVRQGNQKCDCLCKHGESCESCEQCEHCQHNH